MSWISVKYILPPVGEEVLVYMQYPDKNEYWIATLEQSGFWSDSHGMMLEDELITHWKPLEAPEE